MIKYILVAFGLIIGILSYSLYEHHQIIDEWEQHVVRLEKKVDAREESALRLLKVCNIMMEKFIEDGVPREDVIDYIEERFE